MASYPTLLTKYSKHRAPLGKSVVIDRAEDGTARGRSFSEPKHFHEFEHPMISDADKVALQAFYDANRLLPFSYTSLLDSGSGSYLFAEFDPVWQPGNRWSVKVKIEQV